jgi:ribosomal protein L11 methyltransferase
MYLWRRRASQKWSSENEQKLRMLAGQALAVIERPNRKQLQLELASNQRLHLKRVAKQFGGRIEKLPRDWLKRALRRKTKTIKIGNRRLIIPAGAAFGTGEHATTAMCLRMLERVTRFWGAQAPSPALFGASPKSLRLKSPRSRRRDRQHARRVRSPEVVVDLGTGSGILALSARLLGAKRVIGIDNDPIAVSTAKRNARLNNIRCVSFQIGDVRNWKFRQPIDIVVANLFSELLIEILPKIRVARWLVLSGILRTQERAVRRALRRNRIDIVEVRGRGKWVAILAARS